MRTLILLLILTAFQLHCVAAEPRPVRKKPVQVDAAKPRQPMRDPCAAFGAGFVRMEGSSTCIRIGGSVGAGVGIGR